MQIFLVCIFQYSGEIRKPGKFRRFSCSEDPNALDLTGRKIRNKMVLIHTYIFIYGRKTGINGPSL